MASLTGQLVAETYKALLKLIDNDILTASEKQITDGFGGGSNVFIDSQGFLRANKYKITNGLATQFLKADGSLDSNAYLTSITGAQVITALGYTPVPTTRTITINGETHNLAADNSWTVGGTAAIWGNITGTLSNQTDLQNALNAKYNNPTGTISQYIRGDGTIANFPALTGYVPYSGATSNVNLGEYGITSGFVGFDTTPTGTPTGIGTLYWDSANRTLSLIDGDGDTTLQIGQEERVLVHNNTGATLTDGQIVYVTGSTGELPSVALASNSAEATSSVTFGMVTESIEHGADGFITTSGIVHGLNTLAFTEGAALWLGTTPGTFTQTKPVAPLNSVLIGYVIKKAGGNGSVFVKIQNGYELEELHDVYIADPANNHGIFYDIADGLWKNKSIASALGYTPQAQLSGTGFVKALGTTITYDNSTYLTTTDAASTYLALTGGTLSGNLTISSANPKLLLTDTDNNPDYSIQNADGTFKITDETNSADRFLIYSTGIGYYNGDFKANKLFVQGGLSTQFIKADGTLDSNTYLTAASLDGYLAKSGGTMTGDLNFYTLKTTRVGGNAYIRGSWQGTYWGIGAAATGHTIIIDQVDFSTGAYESITDVNLMLGTRTVVHSGNVATYALPISGGTVTGSITATSFVKSGGTSSQFLMADGSVTTLSSPVTGSGSAGYVPKWTTAANIGSSNIYDDGTSIGIAYSTPNKGGYGRTLTGAAFGSASFGFEAVGGTTTNGGLVGGLSFILSQNDSSRLVGSAIQSNLVGTTATNYGADLRFYAKADAGVLGEVARMTSAGLRVYGTIVKDGGTSSQFLMADGSVTTGVANPVGGTGTSGYLPKWTSGSALGNSILTESANGIGIGIASANGVLQFSNSINSRKIVLYEGANNDFQFYGFGINSGQLVYSVYSLTDDHVFYAGASATTRNEVARIKGNGTIIARNSSTLAGLSSSVTYMGAGEFMSTGSLAGYFWENRSGGVTTNSNWYGWYTTSGLIKLYNGSTNLLSIGGSSGNLSIGSDTDAGYKLDVNGTGRFSGQLTVNSGAVGNNIARFTTGGSGGGTRGLTIYSNDSQVKLQVTDNAGSVGSWAFLNLNPDGGNVGIGTASPTEKLHVYSSATTGEIRLGGGNGAGNARMYFQAHATAAYIDMYGNNSYLPMQINASPLSFMGGNVLVGTTTDSGYKFDVNGTGRFSGNLLVSNSTDCYPEFRTSPTDADVFLGFSNTGDANNAWGIGRRNTGEFWITNFTGNFNSGTRSTILSLTSSSSTFSTNIGIGVTPLTKLHLQGNSTNYILLTNTAADGVPNSIQGGIIGQSRGYANNLAQMASILFRNENSAAWYRGEITFNTNGTDGTDPSITPTERMRITSGGNILMRTTTSSTTGGFTNTTLLVKQVADGGAGGGLQIEASGSDNVAFFGFNGSAFQIGTSYRSTGSYQPIDFLTNGPVRMRLSTAGNLMVGTTTDSGAKFRSHFDGGNGGGGLGDYNILATTPSTSATYQATIGAIHPGDGYGNLNLGGNGVFWHISKRLSTDAHQLEFYYNNGSTFISRFIFSTSGNLTATAFFEASDMRLKKLIEHNPIIDGIEKLEAKLYEKEGKIEIGYFAQDAELIMPYAVTKGSGGFLNLSYREIHTAKIARLEKEVAELKAQLNLN